MQAHPELNKQNAVHQAMQLAKQTGKDYYVFRDENGRMSTTTRRELYETNPVFATKDG